MHRSSPLPFFVLRGHEGNISALHFTTQIDHIQQPVLISGSDIGEIFIWNLKTNRTEHRLRGHANKTIMFLHYYQSLLSQGRDGIINIWKFVQQQWNVVERIASNSTSVGFCPSFFLHTEDTALLTLLSEDKHLLKVHNFKLENKHEELEFNPDYGMCFCLKIFHMEGKIFLLAGFENGSIRLWDYESKAEINHIMLHENPVICMDFESHHKCMGISGSVDQFLETWNVTEDMKLVKVKTIEIKNKGINDVLIREDGKIVITAGLDFNVRIFSWKTLLPLAVLKFHELSVQCLAFCAVPIGEHKSVFASGSKDQNIALWNVY